MGVRDGRGRWRARGAGLFALIAGCEALAGPFTPVAGQEYREVADPPTQVHGHALVGAALVGGQSQIRALQLYVRSPSDLDGQVRVSLTTADGRMRGDGSFQGQAGKDVWIPLTLDPKDGKRLRPDPLSPDRIAVSVRYVARGGTTERPLIASWEAPVDPATAKLRLYVNSRRAPEMLARAKDGRYIACRRAPDKSTVRFDTLCELPLANVTDSKGEVELLRRDGFDESMQRVTVGW